MAGPLEAVAAPTRRRADEPARAVVGRGGRVLIGTKGPNPTVEGRARSRCVAGPYWCRQPRRVVKEIGLFELVLRNAARFAAVSGVIALIVWLTWVMLDVGHMQSGFTLPY